MLCNWLQFVLSCSRAKLFHGLTPPIHTTYYGCEHYVHIKRLYLGYYCFIRAVALFDLNKHMLEVNCKRFLMSMINYQSATVLE